jgi:hypothetical protein
MRTNQPTLCSRLLLQWSSAGQEVPHPEGSFLSSQKPTPNVPILSPVNPTYASPSYFLKVHVSCNNFTPSGLPVKPQYAFLFSSPVHTSCPAHLLLSHLINLILSGKWYRSWNSSVCSFLKPPVISCLLGKNVYGRKRYLPGTSFNMRFLTTCVTAQKNIPCSWVHCCEIMWR